MDWVNSSHHSVREGPRWTKGTLSELGEVEKSVVGGRLSVRRRRETADSADSLVVNRSDDRPKPREWNRVSRLVQKKSRKPIRKTPWGPHSQSSPNCRVNFVYSSGEA